MFSYQLEHMINDKIKKINFGFINIHAYKFNMINKNFGLLLHVEQ